MPEDKPQLRASDADRERVADVLRHAAGEGRLDVVELDERLDATYAARTRAELQPLVADVVESDSLEPIGAPRDRMPVRGDGDGKARRWLVAIMGGDDHAGHWRVAEDVQVVNVMGGSEIDLNDAELSSPETTMTVWSIMGGSTIRVPEGLNVDVSSVPIMGGNDIKLGAAHPDPGGPVLKLRLISIMGGTEVRRGRKKTRAQKREEKRLRKAAERGELPARDDGHRFH